MAIYSKFKHGDLLIDIWKIEEPESFYSAQAGVVSDISHDVKRLEHLAGRFLLRYQNKDLDVSRVTLTPSRKPVMECGSIQFSLSHSYPYVACASHPCKSVGIDIQMIREKIRVIQDKFLHPEEKERYGHDIRLVSLIWSAKEALFKSVGTGGQEFKRDFLITGISTLSSNRYSLSALIYPHSAKEQPMNLSGLVNAEFSLAYTL